MAYEIIQWLEANNEVGLLQQLSAQVEVVRKAITKSNRERCDGLAVNK